MSRAPSVRVSCISTEEFVCVLVCQASEFLCLKHKSLLMCQAEEFAHVEQISLLV